MSITIKQMLPPIYPGQPTSWKVIGKRETQEKAVYLVLKLMKFCKPKTKFMVGSTMMEVPAS